MHPCMYVQHITVCVCVCVSTYQRSLGEGKRVRKAGASKSDCSIVIQVYVGAVVWMKPKELTIPYFNTSTSTSC